MKQPKVDLGKLLELHSASTEEEVGQKVVREYTEPAVLASV
jgi:small subunit ribosomal protein S3Ae